ncbi:MAG: MlaE family lipid ABC transporter permease subunit [Hydrogenophaga sp.]|nr:MlaE family lipid ABC transporter permease subunit [Gammaproteobacteria bacterium]
MRIATDRVDCLGPWTATGLGQVAWLASRASVPGAGTVHIDVTALTGIDSAGALVLHRLRCRLEREGRGTVFDGLSEAMGSLLDLVARHAPAEAGVAAPVRRGYLEDLGRLSVGLMGQGAGFLSFIGRTAITAGAVFVGPRRARWRPFFKNLEASGYRALPIVGLLAFLLGVVIAYQGGVQLRQYGANVYIADLVGLAMLRELAPLITAIIVAGRTGASFTAEIGTMKVSDEIGALRTMGIDPVEQLVLPKLAALVIALPLLTVWADFMGLFGGVVIANSALGLSPAVFVERVGESVSLASYVIGVGKAPVFAAIITGIGCFQGFRVTDSAESVGRQTTVSVVQSIFLVIVVDAVFSVVFSEMGL